MTTQVTVAKETACRVRDAKRCVSQVTAAMETTGWVTSFFCFLSQRSRTDVGNFDTDFTREEPKLTPTDKNIIANINQDEFKDFSFVNAHFVSDSPV